MMWTVVKKELRGYFNSALAVIFLALFLGFALVRFFWFEKFFVRGLADLRPLFNSMPLALIILASALSMRLWADERRAGTLEVLLTLPVPRWQLVLGKFIAGMLLFAVALALTFGLPITIARMGNLDLGPVVGGYLATLLLAAAYLAIGMCVSAATDNQIIAFVATAGLCIVTWVIGVADWEVGRLLGTGVRFESVARGVLDLRDLAYYGGIVCVGIAMNVLLLQRLTWGRGQRGRNRRLAAVLGVGLVAANALVLDLWLAPVRRVRIDLTQSGMYSLSDSTHKVLAGLDEQLLIRGYFSEKTHPRLAPLVPELRDLLEEYRIAGGGKVRVELVDPSEPEGAAGDSAAAQRATEAMREAKERFGIDPTPFQFATTTEQSIVNGYFAIAVAYGDQHTVVGLRELITERAVEMGKVEIMLKNPEYELTRAIKKTVAEFSSVDTLFSSTPGKIQLTAYITPESLPENLKDGPEKLKKLADELGKQSGGKLEYSVVEPKTDQEKRQLFEKYGLRPIPLDLFGTQTFYYYLVLQVGDRPVRITPPANAGDAELKSAVTEGLKRAAPGFTRVVGLWTPPALPPQPGMHGMPPQQMPPPQSFRTLQRALSGNYEVRDVSLTSPIPDDVEALVLAGPANLDAKAAEYVDQFVMRGGALVALAGRNRLNILAMNSGLAIEKVATGLEAMFQKWGITVGEDMVMDTKSDALPMPENRDLGNGMIVRQFRKLAYPFFVKVDSSQLSDSMITGGLAGAVLHWASSVKAETKVGDDQHQVEHLLTSSDESWLTQSSVIDPDMRAHPKLGFPGPEAAPADKKGSQVMAISIVGGFTSGTPKPEKAEDSKDAAAPRLIEHSPPDARIVVFGSSAFVSDDMLGLADQLDSDFAKSNLELVQNAVDWTLADTELLAIRSRTLATRAITMSPDARGKWIVANGAIALAGLVLVVVLAWLRRRAVLPLETKEA
jgi:ABC-2 type transport system permease protein